MEKIKSVRTLSVDEVITDFMEQKSGFTDFIVLDAEEKKLKITRIGIENYWSTTRVYVETYEAGLESLFSWIEDGMKPTTVLSKLFDNADEAVAYATALIKNHESESDNAQNAIRKED